ncbi:MAG: flagellar basal body L-ring protein FlgH [Fimbriimonas sp.]
MKKLLILAGLGLATLGAAQTADPETNFGSLFPKNSRGFIESRTAMRKGDILTIVVSEQFTGALGSTTTATKTDSTKVGRSEIPILGDVLKWLRIPSLGILGNKSSSAESQVNGAGTTTSQNRLNGKVAVTVVDVMPNGNLVIEGKKNLHLNKETVTITLSGMVRRDDVRADNTVLSDNVAEAEIRATGRGVIADRQRRGFVTRILDWLF